MNAGWSDPAPGSAPVAYLTKRFPRLSETFILDEILGLESAGVPLELFAMAHPGERLVQPGVARVASSVTYLREGTGWRVGLATALATARAHGQLFGIGPVHYLAILARILTSSRNLAGLRHFAQAGRLAMELRRRRARHLHAAFAHSPASVAFMVHLLTGIPFSFGAHAKDIYRSRPTRLARRAQEASFVVVCSAAAAQDVRNIVGPTARVLLAPHGVDTEQFVPPATDRDPTVTPVQLLAVGRLVAKKGYPVLLEALGLLSRAGTPVACTIIGAGPLAEELAYRIEQLGLSEVVSVVGARTQPEVAAAYQQADVFVQASVVLPDGDRDGIPNSVLEAMASGLPVVASAIAGIPEVVTDQVTGLLVAPADPAALAEALRRLVDDPARRQQLGRAARAHVTSRLDRRVCATTLATLFDAAPASTVLPQVVRDVGAARAMVDEPA